jgi:hypothetical protein
LRLASTIEFIDLADRVIELRDGQVVDERPAPGAR